MLLRRIIEHVRTQNWTAVGLDFVIVVVGVFIGIQVANWNEALANAQREKQVLQEILDDLRGDADVLQSSTEAAKLSIDSTNVLLERADLEPITRLDVPVQIPLIEDVELATALTPLATDPTPQFWARITTRFFPEQNSTAVDALIASGNFSIIGNQQIVRALQRNTALWETVATSHNLTYRPIRDRVVFVGQRHGLSPFITVDLDNLVEIVKSDPELQGAIRTNAEFATFHYQSLEALKANTDALISRIETALGIESTP
ncbi:MAG: hypothetical protein AAGB02_04555 [Pseudomonadota bacterium]